MLAYRHTPGLKMNYYTVVIITSVKWFHPHSDVVCTTISISHLFLQCMCFDYCGPFGLAKIFNPCCLLYSLSSNGNHCFLCLNILFDCGFQFKSQYYLSDIHHTHCLWPRWVWCKATWENVIRIAITVHKTFDCGFIRFTQFCYYKD